MTVWCDCTAAGTCLACQIDAVVSVNLGAEALEFMHSRLVSNQTAEQAAAAGEGIDLGAELYRFDTRALDPVCVHHVKFSEPCHECEAQTSPGEKI